MWYGVYDMAGKMDCSNKAFVSAVKPVLMTTCIQRPPDHLVVSMDWDAMHYDLY
jgi:hypothetical protein